MKTWVSILKTSGYSILSLSLFVAFVSWVLWPVFIPKQYLNKKKT